MIYLNKKHNTLYLLVDWGIDCTNSRNGTPVAIYHPLDNPSSIYISDSVEFLAKFTLYATNCTKE